MGLGSRLEIVPPHFHVEYGDNEAGFAISDGEITDGELPARAVKMVKEWWELHTDELTANRFLAKNVQPTFKMEPLR